MEKYLFFSLLKNCIMKIRFIFIFLFNLVSITNINAQKNDTLFLKNGDRITCEFKNLSLGKIKASTNDMKTIYVEWEKLSDVKSSKFFEFETSDGNILYGFFDGIRNDSVTISSYKSKLKFDVQDIFYVNQLKNTFWKKFSGSVTFGFNSAQNTGLTQYNFGTDVTFLDKKHELPFKVNSIQSFEKDTSNESNQSVSVGYRYSLSGRTVASCNFQLQKNTELGLAFRYNANLGIGYSFIKDEKGFLQFNIGANYNNERSIEGDSVQISYEGVISTEFKFYKFHNPQVDLSCLISYYPSFTIVGRNRINAQVSLSWEIISDLYIGATTYYSYDSNPIQETSSHTDYNVICSLTYKFNL